MIPGSLVVAWVVGILALAARLTRGVLVLGALRRSARPIEDAELAGVADRVREALRIAELPPIAISPRIACPVAMGVLRPVVILPESLVGAIADDALRDVLIHECAHIARRDPLIGLVQRLVELIYWPHPLVHVLNRRLSRSREEACDDVVLSHGDPLGYAGTLLVLADRFRPVSRPREALTLLSPGWKLEDRIAGILDPSRATAARVSPWVLIPAMMLIGLAGGAAAVVRADGPPVPAAQELTAPDPAGSRPGQPIPRIEPQTAGNSADRGRGLADPSPNGPAPSAGSQTAGKITIRGRVSLGPQDQPVGNVRIVLHRQAQAFRSIHLPLIGDEQPPPIRRRRGPAPPWREAKTDANGAYEFQVGPGWYELVSPGGTVVPIEVTAGDRSLIVHDFHLGDVVRRRQVAIDGRVVVTEGDRHREKPVADAIVIMRGAFQDVDHRTSTDKLGRFTFEDLPRPQLAPYARTRDGSLAAFARDTNRGLIAELRPAARVWGSVVDENNRPLKGVPVQFHLGSGEDPRRPMLRFQTSTDDRGRYHFEGLAVGVRVEVEVVVEEDPSSGTHSVYWRFAVTDAEPIELPDLVVRRMTGLRRDGKGGSRE